MATDDRLPVTRDEQAVLDQLEQLQQQIEAVRRKRREANDAFDAFLKSFDRSRAGAERPAAAEPPPQVRAQPRTSDMLGERSRESGSAVLPPIEPRRDPPVPPPASSAHVPPPAAPPPAPQVTEPPAPDPISWLDRDALDPLDEPEPPAVTPAPPTVSEPESNRGETWPAIHSIPDAWRPDRPGPAAGAPQPATLPTPREDASILEESAEPAIVPAAAARKPKAGAPVGLIALLVLVAVGAIGYFLWSPSPSEPEAAPPVTQTAPPATQSAPPVQQPPPSPPAAVPPPAAPAPAAEITTTRVVWLRVLVDGEKMREGEVPAGTKLPFTPKELIVVRAGDAGAVRVSIAGVDRGVVGPDGIAVTRTFRVGQ